MNDTPANDDGVGADPVLDALALAPVSVCRPARLLSPFVFASPHSGRLYPKSFAGISRRDALTRRKSEDAVVDELFDCVVDFGAPLLAARFPRAFVDPNRAPGEIDPAMFDAPLGVAVGGRTARVAAGLGVIPRVVRDGLEIYRSRLAPREALFRLERFYRPYHAALAELVAEARAAFGVAIVVDCHSMPPPARGTDVVVGDCYGESAAADLTAHVQRSFGELGFSVTRNAPYAGGYTTSLHGRPEQGVHAIQIEISRALYLDETRMEKTEGFRACRERLGRFAGRLMAANGSWRPAQAAE